MAAPAFHRKAMMKRARPDFGENQVPDRTSRARAAEAKGREPPAAGAPPLDPAKGRRPLETGMKSDGEVAVDTD